MGHATCGHSGKGPAPMCVCASPLGAAAAPGDPLLMCCSSCHASGVAMGRPRLPPPAAAEREDPAGPTLLVMLCVLPGCCWCCCTAAAAAAKASGEARSQACSERSVAGDRAAASSRPGVSWPAPASASARPLRNSWAAPQPLLAALMLLHSARGGEAWSGAAAPRKSAPSKLGLL